MIEEIHLFCGSGAEGISGKTIANSHGDKCDIMDNTAGAGKRENSSKSLNRPATIFICCDNFSTDAMMLLCFNY